MTDSKVVTTAELALHSAESDCWLAIHGKVYNVTEYLFEHPGGLDVMMDHAGKDATEEFEYFGHSDKARQQMKAYLVGDLEGGDAHPESAAAEVIPEKPKPTQSLPIKIIQALLPLLLVVIAFVIKSYADSPKSASAS